MTMLSFFYLSTGLGFVSSLMVVIDSNNPVFSISFFILSFYNLSVLLFLLGLEFLTFPFFQLHVWAIAFLFLLVLIKLKNIVLELREGTTHHLPISIFYVTFLLGFVFFFWITHNVLLCVSRSDRQCYVFDSFCPFHLVTLSSFLRVL
jgi:NADH:ubiquinone oxidoreductase subunit 6 (subunit J)